MHDLDEIQRCAERAATLTKQLLTFARRQLIEPRNMSLNTLVADLMKLIGKVVGEHIEVNTSLSENVPTIHADRGQIEQVVMNLCLNARDAMPEGGRLVVETEGVNLEEEYVFRNPYMKKGGYALLTVSDTGTGMDEKTRERVFEPFFTTKGPDKGTGLGLAMVYGIVKQHGGFIHLYSEPGKGTTFKVLFPALEDARGGARTDESPPLADWRGMGTILLVDDEESLIALGARMLEHLGFTVLTAADGLQAVDLYRERGKEIDLVLMDLTMPHMDGAEAFGELRRLNPDVRVVLASGYSPEDVAARFAGKSISGALQKPYTLAMLRKSLAGLMPARSTGDG